MDKDRVKGAAKNVVGKIKETLGIATGGKSTEARPKNRATRSPKSQASGATKTQAAGAAKSSTAGGKKSQAASKVQKTPGRAKSSAKR